VALNHTNVRAAGTIGHVAHGKSTVVKAISGVMTVRFKNELVRNITIKLGYANAKVCRAFSLFNVLTSLVFRSTNAKTKRAQGLVATGHTPPRKKTTRLVKDPDAVIA